MEQGPAAILADGSSPILDILSLSPVPCSCYQHTWTPCSLRTLWKRRSLSG